MINLKSISFLSLILTIALISFANFNIKKWKNLSTIDWDVIGYYDYLPATFIYHDYFMDFIRTDPKYVEKHMFWPVNASNGNFVNKYTMGMSVMYAPFFFLAHIKTQASHANPNGFSWYYHKYIHLSCLFYLIIGLVFLRKFLLKWFSEWSVAISIPSICLGTNLFYYASSEAAMSHAYSFSLSAIFLFYVYKWFENQKLVYALLIGISLGLMSLIRPINLCFALFPLLYGVQNLKDVQKNALIFFQYQKHIIWIVVLIGLIWMPQLLYWKSVTGNFFYYSYQDERFFFFNSHPLLGMFSFRNGWLIYTPIFIFSIIGMYILFFKKHALRWTVVLFFSLYCYIVFSWWCWWYVGFGNRGMIDLYALLAIPFGAAISYILTQSYRIKAPVITLVFLLILFSQFQSWQYRNGMLHFDSMNWNAYKASFGKTKFDDAIKNSLIQPDYEKAKKGE
ncbi:MAG: hypothetical protein JNL65_09650 [Saprospiraceae bacterium]|nr:hypothetical protein [Saprospiraceae bacterium]